MKISLSSVSVCTSDSMLSRSSSMTSPGSATRARTSERRPESMLTSPVNWPGPWTVTSVSVAPEGWSISIRPVRTTKNGTTGSPASKSTSPALTGRTAPCAATRATCAGVRVGNIWAAGEVRVDGAGMTGAGVMVSVMGSSRRLSARRRPASLSPKTRRPGPGVERSMARGWESKSVESQIEDAESRSSRGQALTPEQRERRRKREGLELSRRRVLQDLEATRSTVRRASLERALAFLDEEIGKLTP